MDESWKGELTYLNSNMHGVNIVYYHGGNEEYEKNYFKSSTFSTINAIAHCIRFNIHSRSFKIRTNN
jgi:hypothetical protein